MTASFLFLFFISFIGGRTGVFGLRTEVISDSPNYIVSFDVVDKVITFNLTVQTTGFVGFGISYTGGMQNADIITAGVHSNFSAYLTDRHGPAEGNGFPPEDNSQDWNLISAAENATHTSLSISRLLDTCDQDDIPITNDTLRFIWSVGASDDVSMGHGAGNSRGSYTLSILAEPYPEVDLSEFQSFEALTNLTLPPMDTLYWCTVHKAPVFSGKQHAVAFGPVLMNAISKMHSHHLSLYSCTAPEGEEPAEFFQKYVDQGGIDCLNPREGAISPSFYRYCTELVYTFTIGGRVMHMPENVGFPIGEESHMFYLMESHFDNPEQRDDISFETGVRIYYTSELRPIEAGVMRIGQMYDYNFVVPPMSKGYTVAGHCSANCTKQWVPPDGVNLFNVMLHSHAFGKKMKLRQFRNGTELPYIINDENYDNNYQDNRNIPIVKFYPGDHMTIECQYDNTMLNPPAAVIGGFGTRREMCEVVYFYYPRMGLENCRSNILKGNIREFFGISVREINDALTNPLITAPPIYAGMSFLEFLDSLEWTESRRSGLESLMRYSLHEEQCGGDGFQKGKQNDVYYVTYPEIDEEYVPPPRNCSAK